MWRWATLSTISRSIFPLKSSRLSLPLGRIRAENTGSVILTQNCVSAGSCGLRQSWFVLAEDGLNYLGMLHHLVQNQLFLMESFAPRFIKDHFAHLFRLMPAVESPAASKEERWISSSTLLETPEEGSPKVLLNASPPVRPPSTPEPKHSYRGSRSPPTFTSPLRGFSPRSAQSGSPAIHVSPLTPLQFIRRAEPELPRSSTPTRAKSPPTNQKTTPGAGNVPGALIWRH